jgi:hypothetical protein
MKDLEDAVIPTLSVLARTGTSIIVAGDSLRTLAAWAFKTAAVGQELPPNTLKPIGAGARGYLYTKGEPPPGTTVWMLPSTEPEVDAVTMLATFGEGATEVGYMAQIVVGRVRLALIASFSGRELALQPTGVLGVPAIQIWPAGPGVLAR